jgi:hypothetical protein
MRKIIITFLAAVAIASSQEDHSNQFRVDWGSKHLGSAISQDLIVFSIEDFSIIRPIEKSEESISYACLTNVDKLHWAIVENIDIFGQINISSYGKVIINNGAQSILNVKSILEKQSYLVVSGIPNEKTSTRSFELYKINGVEIDSIFYQSGSFSGNKLTVGAPLGVGDYLLVIGYLDNNEKTSFQTFSLNDEQIEKANQNWKPKPQSPEVFCGLINLQFGDLNDSGAKLREDYRRKVPRISSLAASLHSYYSSFYPIPEYSFEYKKTLRYQAPFKGK